MPYFAHENRKEDISCYENFKGAIVIHYLKTITTGFILYGSTLVAHEVLSGVSVQYPVFFES